MYIKYDVLEKQQKITSIKATKATLGNDKTFKGHRDSFAENSKITAQGIAEVQRRLPDKLKTLLVVTVEHCCVLMKKGTEQCKSLTTNPSKLLPVQL